MAQARDEWRASQSELNPERLVFIDETGAATDMARRYGRCPRGQRLVSSVPWGHWKTTTFVAALRAGQIAAPCVFDGPMDGPSFRAYVEQFGDWNANCVMHDTHCEAQREVEFAPLGNPRS